MKNAQPRLESRNVYRSGLTIVVFASVATAVLSASCADLGEPVVVGAPEGQPSFALSPDGGEQIDAAAPELRMCPVTTCALPWATCPSSQFPCDANLLSDDDNCGGCGIRCAGAIPATFSRWSCVDGRCSLGCSPAGHADCDNNAVNGCEVDIGFDAKNCGACGKACPADFECSKGECVPSGCYQARLPDSCDGVCTNLTIDDSNCSVCGNACDPADPNLPALGTGKHYGCGKGKCGAPKCDGTRKADCNNDASDGCEATLGTKEHCGSCDEACAPGKTCAAVQGVYRCLCDDDRETYCGSSWKCKQLDDDPLHCGACNHACPGLTFPHFVPTCTLGVCGGKCAEHYADCDGVSENGCETNARVDNRNCGACGNACSPGQVCSEGKCLVTPCETGEPTAK